MPIVAELIGAVIGVDTHRETHQAEVAMPNGAPSATVEVSNATAGYARLIGWIAEHAPGPHLVVSIEGSRSYGVGLTRAVSAAGLTVVECEQPSPSRCCRRLARGPLAAPNSHSTAVLPDPRQPPPEPQTKPAPHIAPSASPGAA